MREITVVSGNPKMNMTYSSCEKPKARRKSSAQYRVDPPRVGIAVRILVQDI